MKTAIEEFTLALIKAKAIKPSATKDFVKANTEALEMEKKQISKAFFEGRLKEIGSGVLFDLQPLTETFDNYYNETFKK
jgi:hypothetical protein